jgi:hypothetical protein
MSENDNLGYISRELGVDYITIANAENSQNLIIVTLIGVDYDVKNDRVLYIFKTGSGKYLKREFGDFYEKKDQKKAEQKWVKHCKDIRDKPK